MLEKAPEILPRDEPEPAGAPTLQAQIRALADALGSLAVGQDRPSNTWSSPCSPTVTCRCRVRRP